MVPPDMLPPLEATAAGSRTVEVGTIVSAHFFSTANPWPACGRRETSQGHTTVETLPSERKVWTLPLSARRAPKIISNINQLPLVCTAPPCEPPDLHRSQPSPSSFQYRASLAVNTSPSDFWSVQRTLYFKNQCNEQGQHICSEILTWEGPLGPGVWQLYSTQSTTVWGACWHLFCCCALSLHFSFHTNPQRPPCPLGRPIHL
jgi:hypothetical protein